MSWLLEADLAACRAAWRYCFVLTIVGGLGLGVVARMRLYAERRGFVDWMRGRWGWREERSVGRSWCRGWVLG